MQRFRISGFGLLAASALCLTAVVPAYADPLQQEEPQSILCKDIPISSWGDPQEIVQQIKDDGYAPFNIRIEKGCWEVKAHDPKGEVYEFYIHPISKDIVLRKHKPADPATTSAN